MNRNRVLKSLIRYSGLSEDLFADMLDMDVEVLKLYENDTMCASECLIDEALSKLNLTECPVASKFSIGDNIRYARKKRNVSVQSLAKSVKLNPCEVYAIEDDAKPVSLAMLDRIAIALNVALSEILTGDFHCDTPNEHSMYHIKCVLPETLDLFKKNKEYTIKEMARLLGTSDGRMSSFLRGVLPTPHELIKMSEILGVSMSDLTYDGDISFRIVPKRTKQLCKDFSTFAKNLKYLIDKYDYGISDYLEFFLGFNKGVISDYLTGRVGVPDYTIEKIADYYGVDMENLRDGDLTI